MKDPRSFLDCLIQVRQYKLKGDESIQFHLECNSGCDPDGTHYYQPKQTSLKSSEPSNILLCF